MNLPYQIWVYFVCLYQKYLNNRLKPGFRAQKIFEFVHLCCDGLFYSQKMVRMVCIIAIYGIQIILLWIMMNLGKLQRFTEYWKYKKKAVVHLVIFNKSQLYFVSFTLILQQLGSWFLFCWISPPEDWNQLGMWNCPENCFNYHME